MAFEIVRGQLPELKHLAIERAVRSFVEETDVHGEPVGFFTQTMNNIHAAVHRGQGDFWLCVEDGEVMGYMLGHVTHDVDNSLTYWLAQCWAHPSKRGTPLVKEWWQQIRTKAKDYFCKHIVVVSGRGTDAYCRFLGTGWHEYARLLKEDI
jgi:hypothetical protein